MASQKGIQNRRDVFFGSPAAVRNPSDGSPFAANQRRKNAAAFAATKKEGARPSPLFF
jgi:hypothetical protein